MQGHAGANLMPLVAANRIGREQGESCAASFSGNSFISGPSGELLATADEEADAVLTASFDLEAVRLQRAAGGLFRDRRPQLYSALLGSDGAQTQVLPGGAG
jgi:N-carbamoylputrescine amidase